MNNSQQKIIGEIKLLEVDGSKKSGSGTILRLSIALAGILNESLHIYNIRKKRSQPGLRPQHLEGVLTAARLCNADVEGAKLGSQELWFKPRKIVGGKISARIGTAGSISMLILTILPLCIFAKRAVQIRVDRGGTDVRYAPPINYLKYVLFPLLKLMGLQTTLKVHKYGYYPKGMGEVSLEVPLIEKLNPISLNEMGTIEEVRGISVCTFLERQRVAERQAKAAREYLNSRGFEAKIQVVNDESIPYQKGSSIVLWTKTNTGILLGGDAVGELGKPSENVGREAAENLSREIKAGVTVDKHVGDMLVPYVALAEGNSVYYTSSITEHLETNIWITQEILDVKFNVSKVKEIYCVEKI